MRIPSFDLLGIRLHAMTGNEIVAAIGRAVRDSRGYVIANHNLHSLYCWFHEPKMREFYSKADFTHIDGMSLVLLGRLWGLPLRSEHRTGYMDLLPLIAEEATKRGWRIFYLGSKPGVAEKAARTLRKQYPGLQISTHHGHFDTNPTGEVNRSLLAKINDYDPHILMVGMGMPRQEIWVLENRDHLTAHSIFCCGALMDYVAGEIPTPPRWLGPLGLEWLFRLLSEPARLWRRYLIEPWYVLSHMSREFLRIRHPRALAGSNRHD